MKTCDACNGAGRYVGLNKVEDPCGQCDGSGELSEYAILKRDFTDDDGEIRGLKVSHIVIDEASFTGECGDDEGECGDDEENSEDEFIDVHSASGSDVTVVQSDGFGLSPMKNALRLNKMYDLMTKSLAQALRVPEDQLRNEKTNRTEEHIWPAKFPKREND